MPTVSGVPTISGGVFSFTEGGYLPPTWSGSEYGWAVTTVSDTNCYQMWVDSNTQWVDYPDAEWGECYAGLLNQIWTDENYVYAAIDFGLDIIDIVSEMKIAYIEWDTGFNSVWANDDTVYLATSNSGIMYIDKTCISGSMMSPYDLGACLTDYLTPYGITSNDVRYIHGNSENLMCCTASGVDILTPEYRSYTSTPDALKCFLTADNGYYTTSTTVNRVKGLTDWTTPDKSYTYILQDVTINDIYVSDSSLFVATSSGVYVIEEDTDDFIVFYTGS
jgi:hypothetical protein